MACRFEVVLPGEHAHHMEAAAAALNEAERLEALLTVFRDTSELVRINRLAASSPVSADAEVFDFLCLCQQLSAGTGGAFDITSTPLSRCWGFLQREGRLPSAEAIAAARALVGMHGVELDDEGRSVRFAREGMELNPGAIGKGYALDRMRELLRARGVGDALLSAGGSSILAMGDDGGGWPIDLRPRLVARERLARLRIRDAALATSGAGEQHVVVGGTRYGHVIDPRTGWPAAEVLSATVVTREAAVADALSTAFLVGGVDLASRYCDTHPDTLALLVLDDGTGQIHSFGTYKDCVCT